jgi:hypothetical protein
MIQPSVTRKKSSPQEGTTRRGLLGHCATAQRKCPSISFRLLIQVLKGKANSLLARTDLYGSRSLKIPEFLDKLLMKVARLSALKTSRLYPPGDTLVIISVRG